MSDGTYIVADFGKTLAKVSLWSRSGKMLERVTRANRPETTPLYRALDVRDTGEWLVETLAGFSAHPVEAIIPVSHGAAVAGIVGDSLSFPVLDYEQQIPEGNIATYRAQRDPFAQTGSPALPDGLNIGSQLHWLESLHGERFRAATLLPYAQYWGWFLSGALRSEVTSLGCHSDLWCPAASDFSPMARRRRWAEQFAPLAGAADAIGTLRPALAARTGLSPAIRIHCGLHDSNAALLAARGFTEVADNDSTVLSTGTWFIAMRSPKAAFDPAALPEGRDCLVNVDAFGQPVPSARFMGGREIETLIEIDTRRVDIKPDQPALLAAVGNVVANGAMLLPTFAPGFGPYPHITGTWINRPEDWHARRAAACLYAALVAETSLALIGTRDTLLVEGRFAEAEVFVRALASLRPDLAVFTANAHNDVSFGALRLIDPALTSKGALTRVAPLAEDLSAYAARWKESLR